MDTSSLDGAGGSYLDNSIERRCQEWQASEYYNSTDSCPAWTTRTPKDRCVGLDENSVFLFSLKLSRPTLPEYVINSSQRFRITRPASGRVMTRKIRFSLTPRPAFPVASLCPAAGARAPEGAQESYLVGLVVARRRLCFSLWWRSSASRRAGRAPRETHKAREKALADLLSLMEEADEASRLDTQDLERNVAWIRGAGGLERLAIVRAVMPDGELAAAMACPRRSRRTGRRRRPRPRPRGDLAEGFETTRLSRYKLPSFDIVDEIPTTRASGSRRTTSGRCGSSGGARTTAGGWKPRPQTSPRATRGMALDEIRMAALALRRAREHRGAHRAAADHQPRGRRGETEARKRRGNGGDGVRGTESTSCSRVPTPRVFELVAWCRLSTFFPKLMSHVSTFFFGSVRLPRRSRVFRNRRARAFVGGGRAFDAPDAMRAASPARAAGLRFPSPARRCARRGPAPARGARSTARGAPGSGQRIVELATKGDVAGLRDLLDSSYGAAWARAASWTRRRAPSWARRSEPPRSEPRTPDKTRRCVCCSSEARIWVLV